LSELAHVLDPHEYAVGNEPYLVQQVAAAALAELRRRAQGPAAAPSAPKVDPETIRLREEAAQIRSAAETQLKAAQAKAQALLDEAAVQAQQLKAQARAEGEREGKAQGHNEGHQAGLEQGRSEGLAGYSEKTASFQAILLALQAEKEGYLADRELLIVELATRMAAKILAREADTRPDHVQHLLKQAIRRLADKSRLVVTLSPQDLEKVEQAKASGDLDLAGVKQIEFLADERLLPGGLRVQSGKQTLDAALDSQLAELCRAMLEEAYHEA